MPPVLDPGLDRNPILARLDPDARRVLHDHLSPLDVTAGTEVVREGEHGRTMYLVVAGQAVVTRAGLVVARLGPGEHFGELGLIVGEPRAASVRAETALALAALDEDGYRELAGQHPRVALHLLEAIVASVRTQLTAMTDSVGALLQERSLPRQAQLEVEVAGGALRVPTGTVVGTLLPGRHQGHPVVAALVDRRPVSLGARLTSPCALAPLTSASPDGERIHRRGVALLLLEAAHRVDPTLDVRMGHSVGFGQRVLVPGYPAAELPALAARLEAEMAAMVTADLPVREELWHVDEARDRFREVGWHDAGALLETWLHGLVPLVTFGTVQAIALDPPGPSAGALGGSRVQAVGDELMLRFPQLDGEPVIADDELRNARVVSRDLTSSQDRWLEALALTSIGAFNRACVRGSVSELIRVAEGFHEKRLSMIADRIAGQRTGDRPVRIIAIAGPSSSGKTTFIKRLRVQLQVDGMTPHMLSLDDYYVDREATPRDSSGEYDFEAFESLQVDVLTEHLARLCAGDAVALPRYDFKRGASQAGGGGTLRLAAGDVLLVEGIHALNPRLLELAPPGTSFSIFVCPLAQLPFDRLSRVHASDVRLLRRIVRDRHGRGYDAASSIARWDSVRRGERRHIFPHQHRADAVFDTSLVYELSVLRVYAQRYLLEVPPEHPSYTTAYRLQHLLDRFVPIYPDHVPPTSILREFIGGGGFEY